MGLFIGFIGFLIEFWMVYEKIFNGIDLSANAWFLLGFFLMGGGIMLFISGILFDLIIKIYMNTSPRERRYYVRKIWRL